MSTLEIAEISKTDTTVTLKANPSDTSNNNLYVWNTGDITQEITTDVDQKILCFPCENGSIPTGSYYDHYYTFEEPYTPEKTHYDFSSYAEYRNSNSITITTARIKINSEGWLIKTHPTTGNDYYETFKLSFNRNDSGDVLGGVYITYGWYYLTSWYYTKSETVFLPNFDINKYHNYTLIYHKVENSDDTHLWDIDFYVDDERVISQRSECHIYISTYYWNYLSNCSYKFVRNTVINGISSIPEANEYTQLIANITASRNPVVTNVPSLSTSTLTCNVDGIIDRNQEKYSKYKEVLDSYIDCTGDYVKYVNVDGTEVVSDKSTINNEYFNLNTKGSWNIGEHTYHASVGKSYLWEETSQIVSIGNLYTSLMYTGEATGWNNEMHIYPTINNKYVIKTPDYTSEELDGLYDKHTYKLYAIYGDIRPGYLTLILYRDGKEVKFYDSDGNLIEYNQIYMNANSVAAAHTNRFWIDSFHTYDKYNQSNNSTNFYSRKVYNLLTNTEYEEYPELTYLWNTGETTKQITVQPTVPTTYSCTVTQGTRTANASILIDTVLRINELPVAKITSGNIITIPKGPVAIIKANGGIYG